MFSYALRVDLDRVSEAALTAWLAAKGSYFCVRETVDGENPHVHAVLCCPEEKIRIVRQQFVRAFPGVSGNQAYSLTVVKDVAKYDRYMCKGTADGCLPEVVGRQGVKYTDEWVEEMNRQYWSHNFAYQQHKYQSDGKKLSFLDFVVLECKKRRIAWTEDKEIAKIYLELCGVKQKVVSQSQLKAHVEGAKLQLCEDESAVEYLAEKYYGYTAWI